MPSYQLIRYPDRIEAVAFSGGRLFVQVSGGNRYAFDGLTRKEFSDLLVARRPRHLLASAVESNQPCIWAGHCCHNSPCTNDATHRCMLNGLLCVLCASCMLLPRFQKVIFTEATFDIPKVRKKAVQNAAAE